jgi:uncharacterized protein
MAGRRRARTIRWVEWSGEGLQEVVLTPSGGGLAIEGRVLESSEGLAGVRFGLAVGSDGIVRRVDVERPGWRDPIRLAHDGRGTWTLDGRHAPELDGAMEPDISVTPLTNSFPVARLGLGEGQSCDIRTAYVDVGERRVFADPQRYTCLTASRVYRYESLDSDFAADIAFDDDGYVDVYPGLFRRVRHGSPTRETPFTSANGKSRKRPA